MIPEPIKVSLFDRNGWFYFRFKINGKYTRKKVGTKDRNTAELRRMEFEQLLNSNNPNELNKIDQIFFKDYVSIFLKEYGKDNYKSGTYYMYEKNCEILKSYLGEKLLSEITPRDISIFFNNLKKDRRLENPTINRYRALLSKMYKIAIKFGYASHNPIKDVDRLKEQNKSKNIVVLSKEEITRLFAECDNEFYPILATFIYTGMRKGELCGLLVENVKLNENKIIIEYSFNEPTKDHETRIVPIIPSPEKYPRRTDI